ADRPRRRRRDAARGLVGAQADRVLREVAAGGRPARHVPVRAGGRAASCAGARARSAQEPDPRVPLRQGQWLDRPRRRVRDVPRGARLRARVPRVPHARRPAGRARGDAPRARLTIDRDPGLDAARAFAMLLVVALHAAIPFMATPIGWAIEDDTYLEAVDLFVWVGHAFLMPVFFWLAGYFARIVVERDGVAAFVRARLVRVAVPFAVAVVPCSLALHAMWDWADHRRAVVDNLPSTALAITLLHLCY